MKIAANVIVTLVLTKAIEASGETEAEAEQNLDVLAEKEYAALIKTFDHASVDFELDDSNTEVADHETQEEE